ncbi:MAG: serine/threonine-protein kinase PknK [Myxococcales bacterium]|nr:serine/threonine-protein kinase PknK [Myxococcales bacterium]
MAGRYALLNQLGVGGMGEVWRAHDRLTNQTVALKVLRPSIAGAPAAELRFQREIQAMVRLNHPRVVPIIDAGADPVVGLFFVMALQAGRPLHEVGKAWRDWRQMWPVVDQILETLAHAHAHAVIHRDIKPDNVLIDRYGEAILLDFGVARLKDQARSGTSAYDMLGTVDYAAPEQATGNRRRIGPWTDLYCFGIVLYEIICGRLPFWASSPVQSLMLRLDHSCPPLDPRPGFVTPKGLWEVLDQMMQPEPFDRYRHAADARAAFAALSDGPFEQLTPGVEDSVELDDGGEVHHTDDDLGVAISERQARFAQASDGSRVLKPLQAPLRTSTLVGRDHLLLQLSRGLDRWRQSPQPGVLVLSGGPGSGKSRLAVELVSPFLAQGEIEGHRHRWRVGPSMRETALSIAGAIGLSFEAAHDHVHWWLSGHGMVDAVQRQRLVDWVMGHFDADDLEEQGRAFAEFLAVCARPERPYVLTLDGLKVIDAEILALVYAVRAFRLPVIVVITSEVPETAPGLPAPTWLAAANRTLGPLDREALFRIVDELVELPYERKVELVRAAKGNPKSLIAALYGLRRIGEIIPAWPKWRVAPEDWEPPDESLGSVQSMMASHSLIGESGGDL